MARAPNPSTAEAEGERAVDWTIENLSFGQRLAALIISILIGVAVAWTCVKVAGGGYRNSDQQQLERRGVPAASLGTIHSIRLPTTARRLVDLKSFTVSMDDVDDYGRVYVNNYVALTNDDDSNLFYTKVDPKISENFIHKITQRYNPNGKERDVRYLLRKGHNSVVFEIENGVWGACGARLGLTANGQMLEGFPTYLPTAFNVERSARHTELFQRLRAEATSRGLVLLERHPELVLSPSANALCARRILTFELD